MTEQRQKKIISGLIFFTGLCLCLFRSEITTVLGNILPQAALVPSKGTAYPAFSAHNGFPKILVGLGISLMISPIVAYVHKKLKAGGHLDKLSERRFLNWPIFFGLMTPLVIYYYGKLALPVNCGPTNFYINWTHLATGQRDILYGGLWLLHTLFYDYPAQLQLGLALIVFFLFAALIRQIEMSDGLKMVAIASFLFTPLTLNFVNTAEDVMTNSALILLSLFFYMKRNKWGLGLAIAALTLTRPQLFVLAPSILFADFLLHRRENKSLKSFVFDSFNITWIGTAGLATLLGHIAILLSDRHPFLKMGSGFVLSRKPSLHFDPISVDGFSIYPFSGTYLLHLLWIVPLTTILVLSSVYTIKNLSPSHKRLYLALFSFIVLNILIYEKVTMLYFNYRYLVYIYPSLLLGLWLTYSRLNSSRIKIVFGCLLLISPLFTYNESRAVAHRVRQRAYPQILSYGKENRDTFQNYKIVSQSLARSDLNCWKYALKINTHRMLAPASTERASDEKALWIEPNQIQNINSDRQHSEQVGPYFLVWEK